MNSRHRFTLIVALVLHLLIMPADLALADQTTDVKITLQVPSSPPTVAVRQKLLQKAGERGFWLLPVLGIELMTGVLLWIVIRWQKPEIRDKSSQQAKGNSVAANKSIKAHSPKGNEQSVELLIDRKEKVRQELALF
ncbi:MAG: hypothetical protein LBS41_00255 [Streptococcaceae bacterium]|jgi:cytoskeletal protein RodZ|nr:hypothetical protein [Streptococcaceae bacterium]